MNSTAGEQKKTYAADSVIGDRVFECHVVRDKTVSGATVFVAHVGDGDGPKIYWFAARRARESWRVFDARAVLAMPRPASLVQVARGIAAAADEFFNLPMEEQT